MQEAWNDFSSSLFRLMSRLEVFSREGDPLSNDVAFATWLERLRELVAARGTLFLAGNGASASMANHMAADLCKNGSVRTRVFFDPPLLTAWSNDRDFEEAFSGPLLSFADPGDMLVCISSSGASRNILKAAETALELGLYVITLSAFSDTNPLRRMGDLNFYVPADGYGAAETCHAAILHFITDLVCDRGSTDRRTGA